MKTKCNKLAVDVSKNADSSCDNHYKLRINSELSISIGSFVDPWCRMDHTKSSNIISSLDITRPGILAIRIINHHLTPLNHGSPLKSVETNHHKSQKNAVATDPPCKSSIESMNSLGVGTVSSNKGITSRRRWSAAERHWTHVESLGW